MEISKNKKFYFDCDITQIFHNYQIVIYAESYDDAVKKLNEKREDNFMNELIFEKPTESELTFQCSDKVGMTLYESER